MDNLKQKGLNAFYWDYSGKFINQGITFIISIFLARLLEPEDFGLLGMVMVMVALAHSFIDFGFGSAIIQRKNNTKEQISTVFYINIFLGFILSLIMFFSAPLFANFYKLSEITPITRTLSIIFFISSLNVAQNAQLIKNLNFSILTKVNIISAIISGIIGIILAFTGFGVWSLVYRTLLGFIFQTILIWYFSSWRPSLLFNLKSIKEHWKFGSNLFLSGTIYSIYSRIDTLIIGRIFGATDLGYFYRAKSFNTMTIKYTSNSLTKVLFPILSEIQDNKEQVISIVKKSLSILGFIVFGMIGLFYLTAEDLIVLLFSSKWLPAVPFFKIMILYAYGFPISAVLVNVIIGLGNSKANLQLSVIKNIQLTIAIIIGFSFGIEGYLWAMVVHTFFAVLWNMYFVQRQIQISVKYLITLIIPYAAITTIIIILLASLSQFIELSYLSHLVLVSLIFLPTYIFINKRVNLKGLKFTAVLLSDMKNKIVSI